jgi:hypothetical protein
MMASGHEKDPEIVKMVRDQLVRRKSPPNIKALYGRAIRINEEIRELSLRQFNALYPLQVRRELKRKESEPSSTDRGSDAGSSEERSPGRTTPDEGGGEAREEARRSAIRAELLAFARAVARTSGPDELIDLVLDLDAWVERVRSAAALSERRSGWR